MNKLSWFVGALLLLSVSGCSETGARAGAEESPNVSPRSVSQRASLQVEVDGESQGELAISSEGTAILTRLDPELVARAQTIQLSGNGRRIPLFRKRGTRMAAFATATTTGVHIDLYSTPEARGAPRLAIDGMVKVEVRTASAAPAPLTVAHGGKLHKLRADDLQKLQKVSWKTKRKASQRGSGRNRNRAKGGSRRRAKVAYRLQDVVAALVPNGKVGAVTLVAAKGSREVATDELESERILLKLSKGSWKAKALDPQGATSWRLAGVHTVEISKPNPLPVGH